MKASLSMLILPLACAVALAQEASPNPRPQETPQRPAATEQQKTSPTPSANATTEMKTPEMKTTTFKGQLVDMSCSSQTSASARTTAVAGQTTQSSEKAKSSEESNTANRSASDSGTNCPVTASSTKLGMKLDDGRTVPFDLVGNERAQDQIKNNKKWTKAISENKPIQAKVSGVLSGDKLIVSSIH